MECQAMIFQRYYPSLVYLLCGSTRNYSRVSRPVPALVDPVIRVIKNVAQLGHPKRGPKPRQLLSLPPCPSHLLPGRCSTDCLDEKKGGRITAISWVKYYLEEVDDHVIQSHFNKGHVLVESPASDESLIIKDERPKRFHKIRPNEVMKVGTKVYIPVSVIESKISRRFDTIPSGTLHPNADEIRYMQRLVRYKDSAIIVLNKPPKLPVKGNVSVHDSMEALAAAALSYDLKETPKLVHRVDRESSGVLLLGRTKGSVAYLQGLFSDINKSTSSCKAWKAACKSTCMRYWALVIGSPPEKEGIICAPLMKVICHADRTESVVLAHHSGVDSSCEAITEYRVLGPMINGCSWIELRPHTSQKHQLRVHCAEALGTPILGDYKYGWCVHKRWQQTLHVNIEPVSGEAYKLRRPVGLDVQKGSVLSRVPLLHLHCRELVLPNISKFLKLSDPKGGDHEARSSLKSDLLRFIAPMPSHMKISWNLMSSYLV